MNTNCISLSTTVHMHAYNLTVFMSYYSHVSLSTTVKLSTWLVTVDAST